LTALGGSTIAQEQTKPLVDWQGMTLYFSTLDTGGTSRCDAACTAQWPPHYASANATSSGEWDVIHRADGNLQWTYRGRPLYTSMKDHRPGEVNGDGV
jgi:predicted lipoprotein with Yx(FWY)xxD motif